VSDTTWAATCQKCGTRLSTRSWLTKTFGWWWHVVRCAPEYGWQLRSLWRSLLGRDFDDGGGA
jgi:hypothetical protein